MPVAAVLASQRASTSVGGGVTSSARGVEGVPEITVAVAMAGAAPVPVPGPGSVPVVMVVSPAVMVLARARTLHGTSIGEIYNCDSGPVAPVPVGLGLLSGEGGATCGHKVVIPGTLGDLLSLIHI